MWPPELILYYQSNPLPIVLAYKIFLYFKKFDRIQPLFRNLFYFDTVLATKTMYDPQEGYIGYGKVIYREGYIGYEKVIQKVILVMKRL